MRDTQVSHRSRARRCNTRVIPARASTAVLADKTATRPTFVFVTRCMSAVTVQVRVWTSKRYIGHLFYFRMDVLKGLVRLNNLYKTLSQN